MIKDDPRNQHHPLSPQIFKSSIAASNSTFREASLQTNPGSSSEIQRGCLALQSMSAINPSCEKLAVALTHCASGLWRLQKSNQAGIINSESDQLRRYGLRDLEITLNATGTITLVPHEVRQEGTLSSQLERVANAMEQAAEFGTRFECTRNCSLLEQAKEQLELAAFAAWSAANLPTTLRILNKRR